MTHQRCPVPNAHGRLLQADRLWHQALNAYDDPEGFQANLNATIEALRNVTFVLQSEQDLLPEFPAWYSKWRERLKQDRVARWLHDARTTVVHRSDLETNSTAIATVHTNLPLASLTVPVPPFVPTLLACQHLATTLPEPLRSDPADLIFAVERRWTVPDFPTDELLDLLARTHGHLSLLVQDAHQQAGLEYDTREHDLAKSAGLDGVWPCMRETRPARTVRLHLASGRIIEPRIRAVPSPISRDKALSRYGPAPAFASSSDPFLFAQSLIPRAKTVLSKDKHHARMIWLFSPTGVHFSILDAKDRSEKFVLMTVLAEEIVRLAATAIVEVGEAWLGAVADLRPGQFPEDSKRRREALLVSVLSSDGRFQSYITPFDRTLLGRIRFEPTADFGTDIPTYLAPICRVWGLPSPKPVDPFAG